MSLVPIHTRFPATFPRLERDMRDLLERFFGPDDGPWWEPERAFAPRVDIAESEKGYEVTVDLPGIDPKDLTVEIREGSLLISGERKEEKEDKGKTFHRVERHYGKFQRVIPLDLPVDREKVQARYHDGVLKISLAKLPQAESRRIEVKT